MKRGILFFICALMSILSNSFAGNYYWDNPAGGELGDSSKWNPTGTPGVDDYVYFNLPNSYTVWLDNDYTHDRLTVDGSDLTLDLNGFEYVLDTTNDYNKAVIIGDYGTGAVTISNGDIYSGDMFLGLSSGDSVGKLSLSGMGTSWIGFVNSNYHGFFYGSNGDAELSVTDNAYLEHGHGQTAPGGGTTTVAIDGADTEWFVAGYFGMSAWGKTMMTLSNGARARYGFLEMSVFPRSRAVIDVTGIGHETELVIENGWWDPISLFIGRGGTGIINLTGSKLEHKGHTAVGELIDGRGELNINDGSWADCQGNVAVGGKLDVAGGEGLIHLYDDDPFNDRYVDFWCAPQEGQSMVVWPEGKVLTDGGRITMEYGTDLANPIILKGGKLEGWGWVHAEVNNESGVVEPGGAGNWKNMNLFYNYEQGSSGTLKIGIGGTNPGWEYGVLNVNVAGQGQVTLNGILDVDLLGRHVPNYTDQYVIIDAQSVTGQFINAPSQVVFEGGRFDVIYSPTRVTLTHFVAEPKCPEYPVADLNKDCLVNLTDFAAMARQWLECGLEPGSYCP